jgi:hypothetical protein
MVMRVTASRMALIVHFVRTQVRTPEIGLWNE